MALLCEVCQRGKNTETMKIDLAKALQEMMVVGEGLLSAMRFALRVVACGNAFSLTLESDLSRSFSSFPTWAEYRISEF